MKQISVSYTHLDVYKRQLLILAVNKETAGDLNAVVKNNGTQCPGALYDDVQ